MFKKYHRLIGLIMLIPLCLWAATGIFFSIKPGYQEAYQKLFVKTYPLATSLNLVTQPEWQEVRQLKTILGEHLLVKTNNTWQQLHPHNYQTRPIAQPEQIRLLIADAIRSDPKRYGNIASINGDQASTSTGVSISLDWGSLALKQRGQDTELIASLYKLHYLQWTNSEILNRFFEIIGLSLLVILTLLGGWMSVRKS
ncbi:PepSY domain-containing protein [Dasania sp. GY-MA-18]|uniref:PepSY domain-containing protein n=1 Tax=Dasania phycosphaerae TaxID=2950436 RepID=A0A9J6RIV3_9GAMM|nr:PepSY domain-containing protein [Dasania sp. GY-MA-18]MCR8921481.1 PepSY domain-containing protein [Dasania sp. GY-MA-18]MCZ0863909.1 PepSY domain-containing protein [Dasania phycosphaerae]MCZ0867637.1 PepSY domain-containing protein [Dasania phycosphaerae]